MHAHAIRHLKRAVDLMEASKKTKQQAEGQAFGGPKVCKKKRKREDDPQQKLEENKKDAEWTAHRVSNVLKSADYQVDLIVRSITQAENQDLTNKTLGCIELLTVRHHTQGWLGLAQTFLAIENTKTPEELKATIPKYIKVFKQERQFLVIPPRTESPKELTLQLMLEDLQGIASAYIHVLAGPVLDDFFYRDIMVVACKLHEKLKDALTERHISFKTIADLLEKPRIHLLYDKQTQLHVWKHNPPEPGEPDPQEKPDRIDWAREAFDVSGVAYETLELDCSQEDKAHTKRWTLEFMNFHKRHDVPTLTKLPQWAEIKDDIDQDGKARFKGEYIIETLPVDRKNTKKASYASANVVLKLLQKLLANVAQGVFDFYFLAIRPPSHHGHSTPQAPHLGLTRYTHGFCVVNNTAMLIYYLAKEGEAVLLIDIDYHRGDGNQYNLEKMRRPYHNKQRIEHIDVYQLQDFPSPTPYLKKDENCPCIEKKEKKGECINQRHYHGITRKDFGPKRRESLELLVNKILPKFIHDKKQKAQHFTVVLSFGTDAHAVDASSDAKGRNADLKNPKLGPFAHPPGTKKERREYTPAITKDYYEFGSLLAKYRKECDFSVVAVLEGGYHQMSLQCSIAGFLQGWAGVPMSDELEDPSCGPLSHDDFRRWDDAR